METDKLVGATGYFKRSQQCLYQNLVQDAFYIMHMVQVLRVTMATASSLVIQPARPKGVAFATAMASSSLSSIHSIVLVHITRVKLKCAMIRN